ncbi:hypothetical protein K1719_038581 [Acacia pycnantha]|nr:hypothetical protein K1719_038581 [Acacia pycnantha]
MLASLLSLKSQELVASPLSPDLSTLTHSSAEKKLNADVIATIASTTTTMTSPTMSSTSLAFRIWRSQLHTQASTFINHSLSAQTRDSFFSKDSQATSGW